MLEVRNLTKMYNPKKGVPVLALDKINLKFEETGMVFVLGKSGSGKTTLLNLIGGLDSITDGEVIIKGKSSTEFNQSNFDSYRNMFIGFIFQEYNILNELSVGKNIALALELQGKNATGAAVDAMLTQVDLQGYANRRPVELSGGQKQRIAIARALIKDPQIIMADEPTGSLDSNTGKQIFEILQKLSKRKLVIIVSHDRDYAEKYGDRIIEFADGKVISDVKRIDGEGDEKSFEDVTPQNQNIKEYKVTDFKLVRSRLPIKHALRMGASSLKSKPIRLILSILLAGIAFALFGLADTVGSYNKYSATYQIMKESGVDYVSFRKMNYEGSLDLYKTNDDMQKIKSNFPKYKFDALRGSFPKIWTYSHGDGTLNYGNNIYQYQKNPKDMGVYYSHTGYTVGDGMFGGSRFSGIIEIDPSEAAGQSYRGFSIVGNSPTADNEIMISKHLYEAFEKHGYLDFKAWKQHGSDLDTLDSYKIDILSQQQLLGKELYLDGANAAKIVGIINTNFPTIFDEFKEPPSIWDAAASESVPDILSWFNYSYHGALYVKYGAFDLFNVNDDENENSAHINFGENEEGDIMVVLTRLPSARTAQMELIRFSYIEENMGTDYWGNEMLERYLLYFPGEEIIRGLSDTIWLMATGFFWVGLFFAVFASLLLLNFIIVSIAYKGREIGILRALGAKSSDVFMIFFFESLLIALMCFLLASIGGLIATHFIGNMLLKELSITIKLFTFGIRQVVLIFLVSVFTAFIATFLPVYKTARKKPVETIRNA